MLHRLRMVMFGGGGPAAAAERELDALGVPAEDRWIVAANHQTKGEIADAVGGSPGSEIEDSRRAGRLGELGGLVLAAIAIGLPGTDQVADVICAAVGPTATTLRSTFSPTQISVVVFPSTGSPSSCIVTLSRATIAIVTALYKRPLKAR